MLDKNQSKKNSIGVFLGSALVTGLLSGVVTYNLRNKKKVSKPDDLFTVMFLILGDIDTYEFNFDYQYKLK